MSEQDYKSYPVFKGLQRPLEIMGLQGRYIGWAAYIALSALVGFLVFYFAVGFLCGLIAVLAIVGAGAGLIMIKSRKGLHSKKEYNGIYIYIRNKSL